MSKEWRLTEPFHQSQIGTVSHLWRIRMTPGGSGIGDIGPRGIAMFKDQHRCNSVCSRLRLKSFTRFDGVKYVDELTIGSTTLDVNGMYSSLYSTRSFSVSLIL